MRALSSRRGHTGKLLYFSYSVFQPALENSTRVGQIRNFTGGGAGDELRVGEGQCELTVVRTRVGQHGWTRGTWRWILE